MTFSTPSKTDMGEGNETGFVAGQPAQVASSGGSIVSGEATLKAHAPGARNENRTESLKKIPKDE